MDLHLSSPAVSLDLSVSQIPRSFSSRIVQSLIPNTAFHSFSVMLIIDFKCLMKCLKEFAAGETNVSVSENVLVIKDSVEFNFTKQKIMSYVLICVPWVLGIVLFVLDISRLLDSISFVNILLQITPS
ncbi:hypothetical protein L1887_18780 [Cichorium endivia]|nr:hypothetical protein L1887_18780 [Cichorium endivia]